MMITLFAEPTQIPMLTRRFLIAVALLPLLISVGSAEAQSTKATPVLVHEVGVSTSNALGATGTLAPRAEVPLAFAVAGVVMEIAAGDGESLTAGSPLARLDPIPFESSVERAKAQVIYLEKSIERSRMLLSERAISPEELDAQEAELSSARAQLRLAEWQLERSTLVAPFDGVVDQKHVEAGQVVGAGTLAFGFLDIATLECDAAIAASALGSIDLNAKVRVTPTDDPTHVVQGTIDFVPVRGDARAGTVPVRVVIDNSERTLLAGQVVRVDFRSKSDHSADSIMIPLNTVRVDDHGSAVWLVEDNVARRVEVQLGPVRADHATVLSGVTAGDQIVINAPDRLRDGDAVTTEVQR